ncbi:MAG: hypothetical protein Ct9H300mP6_14340 [Gammaproteobacteria bacterium]|nr:MAG: hypothetical protein Ct9H300mP6_14340 [Gammaproteobacteria bacterium]
MNKRTGLDFKPSSDLFHAISSQDRSLLASSANRSLAVALTKIAMILDGWEWSTRRTWRDHIACFTTGKQYNAWKVNPVIPESVCMVAAQVFGHDATVSRAAQSGNFQLNLMLSLIAYDLIESMKLLTNSCYALADKAIKGFEVNLDNINEVLGKNPILAQPLTPRLDMKQAPKL